MATLRPNWFLISPVLIDVGACSWMSWNRCLMPMMLVVLRTQGFDELRVTRRSLALGERTAGTGGGWNGSDDDD
jgi:hypothetical protein